MSAMLRKTAAKVTCCRACDSRTRVKPGERAQSRRIARKRENRAWRDDQIISPQGEADDQ